MCIARSRGCRSWRAAGSRRRPTRSRRCSPGRSPCRSAPRPLSTRPLRRRRQGDRRGAPAPGARVPRGAARGDRRGATSSRPPRSSARDPEAQDPIALALDVSDLDVAERLATDLAGEVGLLKIGLELSWAHGPEAVRRIGAHGPVFVDCKLHDIPTTVERASANVARLGVRCSTCTRSAATR